MKVSEMIEKLKMFSPDAEVKAIFQGDNPFQHEATPVDEIYEIKG